MANEEIYDKPRNVSVRRTHPAGVGVSGASSGDDLIVVVSFSRGQEEDIISDRDAIHFELNVDQAEILHKSLGKVVEHMKLLRTKQ